MINWSLELIALKDLKPHPRNPRQLDKKQENKLKHLMTKFGLIDKPIVNLDKTIIGGHQRIKILKKMKEKNVECWISNIQLEQEDLDELCIGLNLNQGTFDFDILANEWDMIDLLKYGFSEEKLMGFVKDSEKEIEKSIDSLSKESIKQKTECPACGHKF